MRSLHVRVLDNDASSIGDALGECLNTSESADIAVTFARRSGLEELEALPRFQERGGKLRFLAGTDFQQTELGMLDALSTRPDTEVRLSVHGAAVGGRRTFHPKLYIFRNEDRVSALIGSANFTRGGLRTNVETAVLLSGNADEPPLQEAVGTFRRYWTSPLSVPLTTSLRQAYAKFQLARAEALQAALLDQDTASAAARLREVVSDLLVPPTSVSTASGSTWLLVTSRLNFRLCMGRSLWGANRISGIRKMGVGDRIIFYIHGRDFHALGAAGIVSGVVYTDRVSYWPDGSYPYRLPLQILLRPDPVLEFKPLLPRLVGFPKGKSWGTALQRSQKLLLPGDAAYLWDAVRLASAPIKSSGLGLLAADGEPQVEN